VYNILPKRLHIHQLLLHVTVKDREVRYIFYCDLLPRPEGDELCTAEIIFTDEATFHVSGNVNPHNLRI
jgi:hypothetical protein